MAYKPHKRPLTYRIKHDGVTPVEIGRTKIVPPRVNRRMPWQGVLKQKLDRIHFPELTSGESLSEGRRLARVLMVMLGAMTTSERDKLRNSAFGKDLAAKILWAVWNTNRSFLREFAERLKWTAGKDENIVLVYDWMLKNSRQVERCKTVAEIVRQLSSRFDVSQKSFEKICHQIGLPVGRKGNNGDSPKRRQGGGKLPLSSHAKHGSGSGRPAKASR
jgi:hypothetical protein